MMAPAMSMANPGTDCLKKRPVSWPRALRYAPERMLPVSCRAERLTTPISSLVTRSWGTIRAARLSALSFSSSRRMLPEQSPAMLRYTPATGVSGPPTSSGMQTNGWRLAFGTDRSTFLSTICDSAMAALPAPMLPTSLSASICIAERDALPSFTVMCLPLSPPCGCKRSLHQARDIEYQRDAAGPQDGRAREAFDPLEELVERAYDYLLLADQRVHSQRDQPGPDLGDDHRELLRPVELDGALEQPVEPEERYGLVPVSYTHLR